MLDTYIKLGLKYLRHASLLTHCLAGTVSVYTFYRLVFKRSYRLPPGPWGLPVLGNLMAFLNCSMLDKLCEWSDKYGPIFTIYLGPTRTIVINNIDLMTEALVTRVSCFSGRPFLYSFDAFTEGSKDIIAATYGVSWKCQRKVAIQSLRQYLTGQQLEEQVHKVLQLVMKNVEAEKGPLLMRDILSHAVFNVLHGMCFGTMKEFDDPTYKKIVEITDEVVIDAGNGFLEDVVPLLHYWPTKAFTKAAEQMIWFNKFIERNVREHKASFNKDSIRCLADAIKLAQKELTETDNALLIYMTDVHASMIIADVFGAGVDTTQSTLDWIFLVLIAYPDIQARIQKEIDEVVGEKIPGKEHKAKLVYTEAVILETLRLYFVAPVGVPHETICYTSVGGYEIPAGTTVFFNHYLIHRDPKYWRDPLSFKPERFMSNDGSKVKIPNPSFVPFSLGHRKCPGKSLARMNLLYIVAGLLQKFTFSLPPEEKADFTPIKNNFGLRSLPYNVIVKSRPAFGVTE